MISYNTKGMRNILFTLAIIGVLFALSPPQAMAAKKRVRITQAVATSYSSAKLSRASNSIVVTFKNLSRVKRIEYALSYTANGIPQGVMGSFSPTGQSSETRDIYFGTCSKGVCTPHYGVTNASLIITTTLNSGATNTKRYTIKRL
jgi:hypothetical protein